MYGVSSLYGILVNEYSEPLCVLYASLCSGRWLIAFDWAYFEFLMSKSCTVQSIPLHYIRWIESRKGFERKQMPESDAGTELPVIDIFKHFPKQIQPLESNSSSNHEKCSVCRELCLRRVRMFKIRGAVRQRAPRVLSVPVSLSCWIAMTVT